MSIDRCIRCSDPVDTDFNVEWYRSGFDDQCICDNCFKDYECPECGSGDTVMKHYEATFAAPEAWSKNCRDCGHQWDIN